jgi:hypothetical protein
VRPNLWVTVPALLLLLAPLAARGKTQGFVLDPSRSRLSVHVRRAGAAAALLHDPLFMPERWSVQVTVAPH